MGSFSSSSSSLFASLSLLSLVFMVSIIQVQAVASVPAVIAFGDSLIDPGNNNVLKTVSKCDFPPYGRDFPRHKPTGRWSNGKIPTDFIASYLGIKEYLPAYLDPELKDSDLLTGVSFASGGSGFDNITAKIAFANVLTLWDQLKLFEDYKEKLKVIVGEKEAVNIVSNSLYIVCAGTNDLAWTYFTARLRKEYDLPSYIDFMVNSASSFLNDLYGLGARKIGVIGISSIGCLPLERTVNGGIARDCVDSHNQASLKFNYKLITELERLASELPGSRIVFMDVYDSVLDLIQNPEKHGFEESTRGCCATGKFELSILCNRLSPHTCTNVSKFVFWDSAHPTEKAYEILTQNLAHNYLPHLL